MGSTKRKRGPLRILTLVGGALLTLAGLALLVLPGPGIPLLIAGLFLLGREIPAVHRLGQRVKRAMARAKAGRAPTKLPSPAENPPGAEPFGRPPERPALS